MLAVVDPAQLVLKVDPGCIVLRQESSATSPELGVGRMTLNRVLKAVQLLKHDLVGLPAHSMNAM